MIRFALLGLWLALLMVSAPAARAQILWQRAYGTATTNDFCSDLLPLRAGGYLLIGQQETPARVLLIRTNTQGDTLWTRKYAIRGFNILYTGRACEDNAGRVLITGNGLLNTNNPFDSDAFLLMVNTNSQGDSLWSRKFGGPTRDTFYGVVLSASNDFVLTGGINTHCQMMRIAPSGQILQQNITTFCAQTIVRVPGGFWLGSPTQNPATSKIYFMDDAGSIVRFKQCPANITGFYSLSLAEPGYILACGGRLAKFDLNMDTVWTRQLRYYQLLPTARQVRLTTDNHYVMLGENYTNGAREISVHKLDPQGRQLRDTLLQRGYNTDIGGLAVDAATGAYVVAASAAQGPIGRTDIGLTALRPWATVTATAPRRPVAGPLEAWPNPVGAGTEQLRVRPPHSTAAAAELLDLTGRVARRWSPATTPVGVAEWQLPVAGVAPGVYLLVVHDRAGRRHVARLIRE